MSILVVSVLSIIRKQQMWIWNRLCLFSLERMESPLDERVCLRTQLKWQAKEGLHHVLVLASRPFYSPDVIVMNMILFLAQANKSAQYGLLVEEWICSVKGSVALMLEKETSLPFLWNLLWDQMRTRRAHWAHHRLTFLFSLSLGTYASWHCPRSWLKSEKRFRSNKVMSLILVERLSWWGGLLLKCVCFQAFSLSFNRPLILSPAFTLNRWLL